MGSGSLILGTPDTPGPGPSPNLTPAHSGCSGSLMLAWCVPSCYYYYSVTSSSDQLERLLEHRILKCSWRDASCSPAGGKHLVELVRNCLQVGVQLRHGETHIDFGSGLRFGSRTLLRSLFNAPCHPLRLAVMSSARFAWLVPSLSCGVRAGRCRRRRRSARHRRRRRTRGNASFSCPLSTSKLESMPADAIWYSSTHQGCNISVAKRAAVPALHAPILRCRIKAFGVMPSQPATSLWTARHSNGSATIEDL